MLVIDKIILFFSGMIFKVDIDRQKIDFVTKDKKIGVTSVFIIIKTSYWKSNIKTKNNIAVRYDKVIKMEVV